MIDAFAILLTHGLLMLAALRLAGRDELDRDPPTSDAADGGEA